jgi:hypothetical protein
MDTSLPSERAANSGLFGGFFRKVEKWFSMPELASMLLRSSIGTLPPSAASCGECRRTPLTGECVHELDSGSTLCDLCFAGLPEERRLAVRTERVHVSERRLAVVRRAA